MSETIEQALPVPVRMEADERYTGRGVTIAFLDSGFYAHKDLTEPVNRILAYFRNYGRSRVAENA
jgi:hypothetical protein